MIVSSLERLIVAQYQGNLERAFTYLTVHKDRIFTQAEGRYEAETDIYYMVQKYESKDPSSVKWESHFQYIDIQLVLQGSELIEYADIKHLQSEEQNFSKDLALYLPSPARGSLILEDGDFAVFYPEDGHRPGIRSGAAGTAVHKIVFKVRVD